MKTSIRRWAAACVMVLCTAAAAGAQMTTDTVTDVPFAFTAGKTTLPRDTYTISRITGHNGAFLIRGERHGVVILSQPDGVSDRESTPSLIFNRYADQYFLREVRLEGGVAFRLPRTSAEADAAERMAERSRPEVVVVAPVEP